MNFVELNRVSVRYGEDGDGTLALEGATLGVGPGEFVAVVGLKGFEDRFPWELSGGMQQRASLCRALIHDPSLLMLDEPFAALDMFTREELWGAVQDLWLARRPTVILVTHDLREAVFLADRVLVMSARPGRIIAEQAVKLERPRRLETTYEPCAVAIIHKLREHISAARSGDG